MINYAMFSQWAEKQFPGNERLLMNIFFNKIGLLYVKDGFGLYELRYSE